MQNFYEFDTESMGGNSNFQFMPINDIDIFPQINNCVCVVDVIPLSGKAWLNGLSLSKTLDFEELPGEADAGDYFKTKISGMVPKLTSEYLALFSEMKQHRHIVKLTDNNGKIRLSGNATAGMKFTYSQTSEPTPAGFSGFRFTFYLEKTSESPFVEIAVVS